jgi:hypothetical protein
MKYTTLAERFWAKVDTSGDCWVWTGSVDRVGYGKISLSAREGWIRAHRASWELHHGPIPPGLFVCHRCDNPPCIRPDHLFLGTHAENMRDASRKGRVHLGERDGQAKLTAQSVVEIRTRYAAGGVTMAALGAAYGVNPSTIHDAIHGIQWGHVGPNERPGGRPHQRQALA